MLTRGGAEAEDHLLLAEDLLVRATRVTRQLSVDLNPPILKNEGLTAILEWLQGQMRELNGLEVDLQAEGDLRIEDGDARVLLFQIFRELLFNIAKHSGVHAAVAAVQEHDGHVIVTISDRGQGFDLATLEGRDHQTVGLINVRERVDLLGGTLRIESERNRGTSIAVQIPRVPRIGT